MRFRGTRVNVISFQGRLSRNLQTLRIIVCKSRIGFHPDLKVTVKSVVGNVFML